MSRLDTFIGRLEAQRACLGAARALLTEVSGPVLELGLGNGRTYDHLRSLFPEREIFVFERQPAPHPDCLPDERHLIVGDLADTLPGALSFLPGRPVLVHSDLGTADAARNARLAAWLSSVLPGLVAEGGILASDQRLEDERLLPMALPDGLPAGRYWMYRNRG